MTTIDAREEALRRARETGAFSGKPFTSVEGAELIPIHYALSRFPEFDRCLPTATQSFGRVRIAGRVAARREAGKRLLFLTVQDRSGTMQVAFQGDQIEHVRRNLATWDVIGFDGELRFSNSGERTLWAGHCEFLAKSIRLSADKTEGVADKETRYRKRHLDLISDRASMDRFVLRSHVVSSIRSFLNGRDFLEVDTPVLQTVPNGASARPFSTKLNALDMDMTLRIATEIPLKKLVVGGMEKVYEVGRIFRNEGIDRTHNPEFTSVELYQAYAGLDQMMEIAREVYCRACRLAGAPCPSSFPVLDFRALFRERTGKECSDKAGVKELLGKAWDPKMSEWDAIDKAFSLFVEEHLVEPCFVTKQPLAMSPLCRACADDPSSADRFEMYVGGMEVANAYQELTDPIEQRARLEEQGVVDEEFVEALEYGMPVCAGMGIGVDRLVMLVSGAKSIRDVILFPAMRSK